MKNKKFYITTAIDYVNAKPHVGHAFEKTIADALARWKRLQGNDVFFLTGVDENAQKNIEAAQKAQVPVKEFIDKNAQAFISLCDKLNISYDDFIRTSAKEHAKIVQKMVQQMIDKKDIYKGIYTGLYCVGCETYYTEKDLINGKCPEHDTIPEKRQEEAYFFKLSKYEKKILKIIPDYVLPESRKKEMIARIKQDGLNDLCISRKGAKWGIDFPNDPNFKIWVWIDALINYISGLKNKEKIYWPADVHVIGKGINFFHSIIWPAILLSTGYKLPKKLIVHGYLNLGGKKISKSTGNVIDPLELLEKYSSDTVRYSLLRCNVFDDSDYYEEILIERHNNELANKLGNLVSRVSALAENYGLTKTKPLDIKPTLKKVTKYFEDYEFDKALNEIFAFIEYCNEYIQNKKPWETKDSAVLWQLSNAIKDIAILLSPFLPQTSQEIAKIFGFRISLKELAKPLKTSKITKAPILFKKIEVQNEPKDNEKINKTPSIAGVIKMTDMIKYEDFAKLDLRVGTIKKAEDIPDADKLLKLEVDLGNEKRTILAGIKKYYKKEELIGKQIIVIINLEPRKMKGFESQGMLLAAGSKEEDTCVLISPEKSIKAGTKIN